MLILWADFFVFCFTVTAPQCPMLSVHCLHFNNSCLPAADRHTVQLLRAPCGLVHTCIPWCEYIPAETAAVFKQKKRNLKYNPHVCMSPRWHQLLIIPIIIPQSELASPATPLSSFSMLYLIHCTDDALFVVNLINAAWGKSIFHHPSPPFHPLFPFPFPFQSICEVCYGGGSNIVF